MAPLPIRSILRGVNILLAVLVVYGTAGISAQILGGVFDSMTPAVGSGPVKATPRKEKQRRTANEFNEILSINVFRAERGDVGTAKANGTGEAGPVQATTEKLPIKLTLTGTFVMNQKSLAFVIGPDGRNEMLYQLQDCLPQAGDTPSQNCTAAQAKLTGVQRQSITVVYNQRQYTVEMESDEIVSALEASAPSMPSNAPPARSEPATSTGGSYPSQRQGNKISMNVPAGEVEQAFENFSNVLNQARVVPYMVNGQPAGFQIRKIVPGSVFDKLGLTDMDVIKSVNGQSVTDADQALRMFTLFRNEKEIALEIERGGADLRFDYNIQ